MMGVFVNPRSISLTTTKGKKCTLEPFRPTETAGQIDPINWIDLAALSLTHNRSGKENGRNLHPTR